MNYWMQAERCKRKLLGRIIPAEYYEERDSIEKELLEQSVGADAEKMEEISRFAIVPP